MVKRFIYKIIFVLFTLLGLYLINSGLFLISIPESFERFQNVIFTVSGILLILGGFRFLKLKKKRRWH